MYAGLASAMIALIFLYVCASIFIYGGELNSVICKHLANRRGAAEDAPGSTSKSDPFKPEPTKP
jgi:membrane protein